MKEIWKDIEGYEGRYQISNFGNLMILKSRGRKTPFLQKKTTNKYGYITYFLYKNHKGKQFLAHRLVALHFLENHENLPCVNHKNSIKNDNRVENLEWCTYSENLKHSYKEGTMPRLRGSLNGFSKLDEKSVIEIKKYLIDGIKISDLAKMYDVSADAISKIKSGKNWGWLSTPKDIK